MLTGFIIDEKDRILESDLTEMGLLTTVTNTVMVTCRIESISHKKYCA